MKKRIPKIVIAFTCIIALLLQYAGTVVMAAMSYTDRTAKLVISPLHEGGEESSGTLTNEQRNIYDEDSYVYFIGNTRVYKISKEGSLFEDALYCLDASKSFPAQSSTTYTNTGELSENDEYNTNSLKWLMNNVYLQKQEPETKDAFLKKAFNGSEFDVNAVKAILTDDDIDVIQQYAIWHFTNNDDPNYSSYGAIRVISSGNLGTGGIVDVNNSISLSDIDREKYSDRPDMAKHLYNYLVNSAQNASEEVKIYPTIKNTEETKTVIQNGFYVAGPFEITSGNVEYDVKLVDQNNNELREYNVILENGSIATQPLNKINTPFYIQLPTTSETTSMKLKLLYNKYETKATIWQPENNDKQPVVLINRVKENVEQEQPVIIVKKGSYNLEIIKQDKDSKARLAGAKFNVQIGSGEVEEYTTDDDGILTIPKISITEVGKDIIKITETQAPEGYTKTDGTLELEVTKAEVENELVATEIKTLHGVESMTPKLDNKKVTVIVDNEKIEITGNYEIELIKQDIDSKEKLSGAEFGIKFGTEAEKTYITDNQGKITIPNIEITEAGTDKIAIREIKAPTGYRQISGKIDMIVTTAEFDGKYAINDIQVANSILNASVNLVSNKKIAIVVDNVKEEIPPEEPSTYKLQVIKRDKNLNVNLDGADFSIQIGNQEPKIYTTNEAGIIEIPEIEIKSSGTDRIVIQEINPPYGYIANDGKIELIVTKTDIGGKYKITKLESEKTTAEVEDAYIDDETQTVVVKVCNTKIPYEKPDDEEIKGKYEIEIVKVDRNGEIIKAPANFNVDGKVYTTQNGTVKVAEVDINKSNVNQTDKYTIKETKSPDGYTKFDGTIEVEVLKKLSDDEGSYKATNVNMIVRDSEGNQLHRGDKITITTKNGVTTITITVVNYEKVDLSLRKFIRAVSSNDTFEENDYIEGREPKVDLEDLDNGKSTTAKYNHSKETVIVKKGNYILYTLRTYNEGNCDAMASQITDYLPEGLEFVKDAKENNIWNYDEESRKLTTNENYKPELLKAHKKGEELKYQDLQVVCKVKEDIGEDTNIVNIAEITEAKYNDGTIAEDRDSTTNNLKYPEDLSKYNGGNDSNKEDEYIPGQEDDDDFERILVKSIKGYYDLEIVKVDNKGNIIKESNAKFDINGEEKETKDGILIIENIEINKHNAETPDTYTIKETNAPKDYTKFNIPIRIEVSKKLSEDKEKYEVDNVSMKILSGEIVDSKDFEVVTENGKTKIVVKVVNYPKVDLALRKFITAVSKDTTFEQSEYVEDREPKVDISDLDDGKSTTAEYKHSKTTVEVEKEDYILYTIRVYNEGNVNAYPTEVTDYLPEGLEFVSDAKENRIWDYDSDTRKLTTNSKYEAKLLKAHEVGKDLDYVDLQVVCRVSENVKEDTDIINIAEITLIKHEDGTTAEDRDSTPDNVKPEDYKPNTEDDDDQEKVLVKSIKGEYNLKVIKVDENGKLISDIVTKFKINDEEKETENGVIELSKVEINKDNVDKKDTYEITETEAPKGYEKIDETIKLEVSKKLAQDEKSYVLDKAEFVIEEKENTDDKKEEDTKKTDKKDEDKKDATQNDETKKEEDKNTDNTNKENKEERTSEIKDVASVTVKDGTIEVKVVNKKVEEPKKPDEPQKPDEPKQPNNPQQPTPEQPKTPDTPQKEIPKETITTPSTGDMLPVVALSAIIMVVLINIGQILISRRKK